MHHRRHHPGRRARAALIYAVIGCLGLIGLGRLVKDSPVPLPRMVHTLGPQAAEGGN